MICLLLVCGQAVWPKYVRDVTAPLGFARPWWEGIGAALLPNCSFRGRRSTLDMVVIVKELRFRDRCSESRLLDMWLVCRFRGRQGAL